MEEISQLSQEESNPNPNPSRDQKPYNLEPNIEAALSYFITPITGVVVYMMEKENKFIRFHAFQSILFGITAFAAWTMANYLTVIFIGLLLMPLVSIVSFLIWLFLMWKAYNNEEFELPVLGKIVRDQMKN